MQAARELEYRPNAIARSLISGRSRMIGLLAAYLDNQFYPIVLERLARALQARGYHTLLMIFVANDHMAFAAMDTLRQTLKLEVPGQVAVAGFDDVPQAAWDGYSLA